MFDGMRNNKVPQMMFVPVKTGGKYSDESVEKAMAQARKVVEELKAQRDELVRQLDEANTLGQAYRETVLELMHIYNIPRIEANKLLQMQKKKVKEKYGV